MVSPALKFRDESRRISSPLTIIDEPPGSKVWPATTTCAGLMVYVLVLIVTVARVLTGVMLGDPSWLAIDAAFAYAICSKIIQKKQRIKECI